MHTHAAMRPKAILARAEHLVLALLQRLHRLDARRVARRKERRDHAGHDAHHHRDTSSRGSIIASCAFCRTPNMVRHHLARDARQAARERQPEPHSGQRTDQPRDAALRQKQRADLPARRAQRPQDADLGPPLRHRDRERVVDDEHPDEEREQAGDLERQRVDAEQVFEVARAPEGGSTVKPRPDRLLNRRLALFQRDALAQADIDAVEAASAPEHVLRGIDVHDREIAAECLRHAAGLQQAAHGELLRPSMVSKVILLPLSDVVAVGESRGSGSGNRAAR